MEKTQYRERLTDLAKRLEAAGKLDFALAYIAGMLDADEMRSKAEAHHAQQIMRPADTQSA